MRLIDLLYLNVDKKILNISISILMLTLTLSIFQITDRVNQYISTQENILLQQQEIIISAKDLSSDLSLFAVLYFEIYLYDNNGLGNFDEVEINIKKLIENDDHGFICDIKSCSASNRHYRVYNNNENNLEIDPHLNVYCHTMDSVHVYLLHSHQFGLRIINHNTNDYGSNGDEQKHGNDNYDHEFVQCKNKILLTRDSTNRFERISSGNNKYKINTVQDSQKF